MNILLEDYAANLPPDAQRYLVSVNAGAKKMDKLIQDLLNFSRLGRHPLTKKTISMKGIVDEILEELKPERESRQVEIHIDELPSCEADPVLLKQVFINLLGNALKYSRTREIAIIHVGCQADSQPDTYFVKDNGVGFDMKYADKLFGVFQRLHSEKEFEGTGVGLANVQRIITRHGGRIWAHASVNEGATFYFTLSS